MSEIPRSLHLMTIRDILDRSIQLYKSDFLKFVGVVVLVKGPYLILGYIITRIADVFLTGAFFTAGEEMSQMMEFYRFFIVAFLLGVVDLLLVGPILIAAMTMVISKRFLDEDISIASAYKGIVQRIIPLLGTILLTLAIIVTILIFSVSSGISMLAAGSQAGMLLFLGGLVMAGILWIRYAFIAQAVVIGGEGGRSAMKRSKYLVKGNFTKSFILIILVFIAMEMVKGIASIGIVRGFFFLGEHATFLAEGASNVLSVLLEPFRIAVIILLYYDFRVQKEGFDLEIMAEELRGLSVLEREV